MAPIMIIHADDVAAMATLVLLLLILVVSLMMIVVRWYNNVSIMVRQKVMIRRMRYQSYWVVLTWESAVFGHVSSPVHVRPK